MVNRLDDLKNESFQVSRFGDGGDDGVVLGLDALLEEAEGAFGVKRRGDDDVLQLLLADVVGAGAGDQDATGAEHFQGAKVEFFVATGGGG